MLAIHSFSLGARILLKEAASLARASHRPGATLRGRGGRASRLARRRGLRRVALAIARLAHQPRHMHAVTARMRSPAARLPSCAQAPPTSQLRWPEWRRPPFESPASWVTCDGSPPGELTEAPWTPRNAASSDFRPRRAAPPGRTLEGAMNLPVAGGPAAPGYPLATYRRHPRNPFGVQIPWRAEPADLLPQLACRKRLPCSGTVLVCLDDLDTWFLRRLDDPIRDSVVGEIGAPAPAGL